MSTEQASQAAPRASAGAAPTMRRRTSATRGLDAMRPLGPKAALLHARRRRAAALKAAARLRSKDQRPGATCTLASDDGAIAILLKPSPCGLYVERTQRRPLDAHIVQAMVFASLQAFGEWCEADPLRFDHPLLYSRLRRYGDELLGAQQ